MPLYRKPKYKKPEKPDAESALDHEKILREMVLAQNSLLIKRAKNLVKLLKAEDIAGINVRSLKDAPQLKKKRPGMKRKAKVSRTMDIQLIDMKRDLVLALERTDLKEIRINYFKIKRIING